MIAVNIGAEDLMVSEKETATYFRVMREQTIVANLKNNLLKKKTVRLGIIPLKVGKSLYSWRQ